nr:hypothetical protein [Lachnospiraceae bacterium]
MFTSIRKYLLFLVPVVMFLLVVFPLGMVNAYADGLSCESEGVRLSNIEVTGLPEGYSVEGVSVKVNEKTIDNNQMCFQTWAIVTLNQSADSYIDNDHTDTGPFKLSATV